MIRGRTRALIVGAASAIAALGFGIPAAIASTPSTAASAPASVSGNATVAIGHMTFDIHDLANGSDASTGTFDVQGDLLPVTLPGLGVANQAASYNLAGPATCLDVQGNKAGLVYPMTTATGTVTQAMKGLSMYITVQAAANGQPAAMGFVGPLPTSSIKSCPPLVAFMPLESGSITVTPGS